MRKCYNTYKITVHVAISLLPGPATQAAVVALMLLTMSSKGH